MKSFKQLYEAKNGHPFGSGRFTIKITPPGAHYLEIMEPEEYVSFASKKEASDFLKAQKDKKKFVSKHFGPEELEDYPDINKWDFKVVKTSQLW